MRCEHCGSRFDSETAVRETENNVLCPFCGWDHPIDDPILNMTQHWATKEQRDQGVFEPSAEAKRRIENLLTFNNPPDELEKRERARRLAEIARQEGASNKVMIGGAPFFMSTLESALRRLAGCEPVYAFSKRESIEEEQEDGSIVKRNVFRHIDFV